MSWTALSATLNCHTLNTTATDIENNTANGLLYPLASFSALEVSGPDRFSFLQGQITCDTRRLEKGESLIGAHLNLKGRIEASFIAIPTGETLQLVLPNGQAGYLLKLLQKYALFSQVQLQENQASYPFLHWTEQSPHTSFNNPHIPAINLGIAAREQVTRIFANQNIGSENDALAILARNGLVLVEQTQRDRYLPQELNYDAIDGISFNKGCYKGQEVVARIHFKGKVKKRLAAFTTQQAVPDNAVFYNDKQQKCAELITCYQTSKNPDISFGNVLLKPPETEPKPLHLEQNDGLKLTLVSLPYAIN